MLTTVVNCSSSTACWSTELRFYVPHTTKRGHIKDVLPGQSPGLVQKKLNLAQQMQTTQEQNDKKNTQKANLNLKNT